MWHSRPSVRALTLRVLEGSGTLGTPVWPGISMPEGVREVNREGVPGHVNSGKVSDARGDCSGSTGRVSLWGPSH